MVVRMILATLASIAIVLATLLLLLVYLFCSLYMGMPPQGSNAMGLVIPFFALIAAGILMLASAWLAVGAGGLGRYFSVTATSAIVATVVVLAVWFAAAGTFISWSSAPKAWVPAAGVAFGLVSPIILAATMLYLLWTPPDRASVARLVLPALLAPAVLAGIAYGIAGLVIQIITSTQAQRAVAAADADRQGRIDRYNALSPFDQLKDTLSQFAPDSELWTLATFLLHRPEREQRDFIISRCLAVPNFDVALAETLSSKHFVYRYCGLQLLAELPAGRLTAEHLPALLGYIRVTTAQLKSGGDWFEDGDLKPADRLESFRTLSAACARFDTSPELADALSQLRAALATQPDSSNREAASGMLRSQP
jgi:hypothetical protein